MGDFLWLLRGAGSNGKCEGEQRDDAGNCRFSSEALPLSQAEKKGGRMEACYCVKITAYTCMSPPSHPRVFRR